MSKTVDDIIVSADWAFPEVNRLTKMKGNFPANAANQTFVEEKKHVCFEQEKKELQNMADAYAMKMEILSNISKKLENPLMLLDDDLVDLIQEMLKKAVSKIINKEIKSDIKLVKSMIEELKASIPAQEGIMTIYLSERDHKRIMTGDEPSENYVIKANPSLNDGDIIIKSNKAEIKAILSDRIEKLFGTKK